MASLQRLPIRDESPPPDDWLVLRGGSSSHTALRPKIRRSIELFGVPLVSVVVIESTHLERALKSRVLAGYKVVTGSTVHEVTAAGFRLIPTFSLPHYSVELPDGSETSLGRFIDNLTIRMENPFHER